MFLSKFRAAALWIRKGSRRLRTSSSELLKINNRSLGLPESLWRALDDHAYRESQEYPVLSREGVADFFPERGAIFFPWDFFAIKEPSVLSADLCQIATLSMGGLLPDRGL